MSLPVLFAITMAAAVAMMPTCVSAQPGAQKLPKRLKRSQAFLGIHFDFHAGEDCTEVGKNTTRRMIETIIDTVKPDYIQTDCKGHPGYSSYPTKVGNQAPGIIGDPLKTWREVTAERGVGLFMHYSGVWDSRAIEKHPEWAVTNADGGRNGNATSVFGPYVDQLLIPQLRELAGVYGIDGVWVDGECWATQPDYGAAARAAFRTATGIETVPIQPGQPHWQEWLNFNREGFRKYMRHYIDEVHKTNPTFQICSNWAFSDHMPEPVSAPIEFISGDFSPSDAVNSARFSARYISHQGKPWDLMAWSFAALPNQPWEQKPAVQLKREAAIVLALGGGFQAYFTQRRDGSVKLEQLPVMGEVARFCREREKLCHNAVQVPQVALLYSTVDHYNSSNGLFPRDLGRIAGTLQALVEGQRSVDVVGEHGLKGKMASFPLIVIPEVDDLEPAFVKELSAYVKGGGKLMLVGASTAALFTDLISQGTAVEAYGPQERAASVMTVGKGKVAVTRAAFSGGYLGAHTAESRDFLNSLAGRIFTAPLVTVTGSHDVDVSVTRTGGKLAVNLVNTSGPHRDYNVPLIDHIDPVGPLTVAIRTSRKPAGVTLEPGGTDLPVSYSKGVATVTVPTLEIHSIVLVH